jgi:hypothetical protein
MNDKRPRNLLERFQDYQLSARELGRTQFEDRERGEEAEARSRAYMQNAFATLSPTRELLWYGAQAGLQVGAALLAVETAILIALVAAAVSLGQPMGNLYGPTPLSGTFFEPLWPIAVSLPIIPLFSAIGAVAALARRWGSRRRRSLDHFFSPASPREDLYAIWGCLFVVMMLGSAALGFLTAQGDPSGMLLMAFCASGLLAWPSHWLWTQLYLPLIRARGSASLEEIKARIERQI